MLASQFVSYVCAGRIPPENPHDACLHSGYPGPDYRGQCTERGMWAIVSRELARELAAYIGPRRVLEVMAGAGWLARALADEGVSVLATDNRSWDARHSKMERLYPVEVMEASKAVRAYPNAEVLLVSWPPYGETAIIDVCRLWGSERPIIYIGEDQGGCNAPAEWWCPFDEDEDVSIPLAQWYGMRDYVSVGYWLDEPLWIPREDPYSCS